MTTLLELAQARLREQRDAKLTLKSEAEALRVRLAQEGREVIRLVERDILQGTELPIGATVGLINSSIHGHQVAVRFPGNLSIDAKHRYMAAGDVLLVPGSEYRPQYWIARLMESGVQKTFDDFVNAAIWLLDIKLEES